MTEQGDAREHRAVGAPSCERARRSTIDSRYSASSECESSPCRDVAFRVIIGDLARYLQTRYVLALPLLRVAATTRVTHASSEACLLAFVLLTVACRPEESSFGMLASCDRK
jgi:hypothetical protein